MGQTRRVQSAALGTGALGVVTHFVKWTVGGTGAVTAGTVKAGGDMLVTSVAKPGVGRYTVTLNPQHILGVAKISASVTTPAQTDTVQLLRVKSQGTDGILTTSGVQSFEVFATAVSATGAAGAGVATELLSGSQVFIEITEYTTDAAKKYYVG